MASEKITALIEEVKATEVEYATYNHEHFD